MTLPPPRWIPSSSKGCPFAQHKRQLWWRSDGQRWTRSCGWRWGWSWWTSWQRLGTPKTRNPPGWRSSKWLKKDFTCWLPSLPTPTSLLTSLLNLSPPFTSPLPSPRLPRDSFRTNCPKESFLFPRPSPSVASFCLKEARLLSENLSLLNFHLISSSSLLPFSSPPTGGLA